jgi:hypothetical protein
VVRRHKAQQAVISNAEDILAAVSSSTHTLLAILYVVAYFLAAMTVAQLTRPALSSRTDVIGRDDVPSDVIGRDDVPSDVIGRHDATTNDFALPTYRHKLRSSRSFWRFRFVQTRVI